MSSSFHRHCTCWRKWLTPHSVPASPPNFCLIPVGVLYCSKRFCDLCTFCTSKDYLIRLNHSKLFNFVFRWCRRWNICVFEGQMASVWYAWIHQCISLSILAISLTKLFACGNISQRPVCNDLALSISHPPYVLFLGRVVEHASQSEYDGLCDLAIAVDVYDWPVARMSQVLDTCDISSTGFNRCVTRIWRCY
jgi:hypothetical protein